MFNNLPHLSTSNVKDSTSAVDDLDPDMHFKNITNSNYIFGLNDIKQNHSSFSTLSFNIRSIKGKFDDLENELSSLTRHIDIIYAAHAQHAD